MKPIRLYLDEAEDRGIVKNDSELARRLGVSRQSVNDWRKERTAPNEDQAAALADLLGKPEVMPECAAARAKTPAARAAWERLAKMASMTAGFAMLPFVVLYLTGDSENAMSSIAWIGLIGSNTNYGGYALMALVMLLGFFPLQTTPRTTRGRGVITTP